MCQCLLIFLFFYFIFVVIMALRGEKKDGGGEPLRTHAGLNNFK